MVVLANYMQLLKLTLKHIAISASSFLWSYSNDISNWKTKWIFPGVFLNKLVVHIDASLCYICKYANITAEAQTRYWFYVLELCYMWKLNKKASNTDILSAIPVDILSVCSQPVYVTLTSRCHVLCHGRILINEFNANCHF